MATDRIINQTQGDEIITALIAIKNAINDQPVPTTVEDVVAAEFSDGVSYTVGQYVIKDGLMYKCTTAHHGAWNGSDFTLTTTGAQLTELNSALTDVNNDLKQFRELKTDGGQKNSDVNGFVSLGFTISQKIVIGATATKSGSILYAIPFIDGSGNWWLKVNNFDNSTLASATVNVAYIYYDV